MISSVPALTPFALACALFVSTSAARAAEQLLPEVTVTGARFASDPALAPIGATVISAEDIRRAGAADVNQAIRKIGGVYGRQSLDGSPDFGLDLRGFGSNSSQNMVLMLDGVRLSENELGGAVLSSIPIETVQRIDIIRGGASVLFGEGATGGVIHIITKRAQGKGSSAVLRAEAGQFDQRDLRASMAQSWDGFALDAAVGNQRTDNDRLHSAFRQNTFSGGAQWAYAGGRVGVRYDRARQQSELAGSLTLEQFERDPRIATTAQDVGALDADRVAAVFEHRVGSVDLAAELSRRDKTVEATYYYDKLPTRLRYDSRQTQFSPRLRQLSRFDGMVNELVAGVDLIKWQRASDSGFSDADALQKSRGLYVRDELKFAGAANARLAAGVRRERFEKDFTDARAFAVPYHAVQYLTAWDVQGSYDVATLVSLYAKTGRSYRMPNADENAYRAGTSVLDAQTSRDLELGLRLGDAAMGLDARAFRHDLRKEIFYDPTLGGGWGANANLDPTERKGLEVDAHADVARGWRVSAHLQHVLARFTEGPNAGREMVLVPKNVVSARLAWTPAAGHSADLGVQWADSQRYGSDFTNTCSARIPAAATLDARYARQLGAWEIAVAGLNLTDKQYFSNAFGCRSGIYPSDGRQLKLSVRYDFK